MTSYLTVRGHAFLVGAVLLGAGCASTFPLTPSARTPAAIGSAKVSQDSQGNTDLAIKVNYLPKPVDLGSNLTTFVVWSVADQGARVRNMGKLKIDNDREGSVDLVTPLSAFRIVVTAEENGSVEKPSEYVILNGDVSRK